MNVVEVLAVLIVTDGWAILFRQAMEIRHLARGELTSDQWAQPFGACGGRIVDDLTHAASGAGQERSYDIPMFSKTLVNLALRSRGKFIFQ